MKVLTTHSLLFLVVQNETKISKNMGWESFDVVRFDLGLLLQGKMRVVLVIKLKVNYLILCSWHGCWVKCLLIICLVNTNML